MHEEVFMTSDTYPHPFVRRIFHNGYPSQGGDRKNDVLA